MPSKPKKTLRQRVDAKELESLLKNHLSIRYNARKDLVEIGWVCSCRDKKCHVPHTTVAFYVCPYKPCPPGSFLG